MDTYNILKHIFSYSWPKDEELAEYAKKRHGFGGDDASYGVTYPSDLDEYDRSRGEFIPEGKVEIYCKAFGVESLLIDEKCYLRVLKSHLALTGKEQSI